MLYATDEPPKSAPETNIKLHAHCTYWLSRLRWHAGHRGQGGGRGGFDQRELE